MNNIAIALNKNPGINKLLVDCPKKEELIRVTIDILSGKNPKCRKVGRDGCGNKTKCEEIFSKNKVSISNIIGNSNYGNELNSKAELYKNLYGKENVKTMTFEATSNIAVGLGNPSVQEISLAFHPLYGYPYIPGEGIKGVVRRLYIQEKFDNVEKDALNDAFFQCLFGSQQRKGALHFFDAIPAKVNLVRNIMNPHYTDYYSSYKAPGDDTNPSPIFYLVVEKGSTFELTLAIKKSKSKGEEIINIGKALLEKAITENGVGGKTTSAFGRMRII